MSAQFEMVGIRQMPKEVPFKKEKWYQGKPVLAIGILIFIIAGCLCCNLFITKDPAYLDLANCSVAPGREFFFGTDAMGRDIFSMIWYGGRISLLIGMAATLISTAIAIIFGSFCGCAPKWADMLLMRLTDIWLSVPDLLIIILIQAVLGKADQLSLSFVIGITSWTSIAKVVRTEVRRLRSSEYV
ncbi:MAG: ABC transporter permease, partial [Lachnospiraceae bacterium]|nr:ABC transporter permease [Lachnospiraceae bacterium]